MKPSRKGQTIENLAKNAGLKADKLIARSKPMRDELSAGRPNSSSESTTEGTLEAFKMLISGMPSPLA